MTTVKHTSTREDQKRYKTLKLKLHTKINPTLTIVIIYYTFLEPYILAMTRKWQDGAFQVLVSSCLLYDNCEVYDRS